MKIIEWHQGCGNIVGCFGPRNPYYTIFGSELRFLMPHIIISIILGIILFGILISLKKKGRIKMPIILSLLISIVAIIVLFFALAYIFPVRVLY